MTFINNLDDKIYYMLFNMQSPFLTKTMIIISFLASALTLIALSIALIIILKEKKYSRSISLNLILVYILSYVLKYIFRRPRPGRIQFVTEKGFGFPSGHVMVSFAYYGFIIYLVYKNIQNKKIRNTVITLLSILLFLVGISRVYLGVHYVTDVLGAYVFGFIYLFLFIKYVYNKKPEKTEKTKKENKK